MFEKIRFKFNISIISGTSESLIIISSTKEIHTFRICIVDHHKYNSYKYVFINAVHHLETPYLSLSI